MRLDELVSINFKTNAEYKIIESKISNNKTKLLSILNRLARNDEFIFQLNAYKFFVKD